VKPRDQTRVGAKSLEIGWVESPQGDRGAKSRKRVGLKEKDGAKNLKRGWN